MGLRNTSSGGQKSSFIIGLLSLLFLAWLLPGTLYAKERRIDSAQELQQWCKQKSWRHFTRRKLTPYNWTSSWWLDLNTYRVEGQLRVNNRDREVECYMEKGTGKAVYRLVE